MSQSIVLPRSVRATGAAVGALLFAGGLAAPASALEIGDPSPAPTLQMQCTEPIIGDQPVVPTVTTNLPARWPAGTPLRGIELAPTLVLEGDSFLGFQLIGAAYIKGLGTLNVRVVTPDGTVPIAVPVTFPPPACRRTTRVRPGGAQGLRRAARHPRHQQDGRGAAVDRQLREPQLHLVRHLRQPDRRPGDRGGFRRRRPHLGPALHWSEWPALPRPHDRQRRDADDHAAHPAIERRDPHAGADARADAQPAPKRRRRRPTPR